MADADSTPGTDTAADTFIDKWQGVTASELSTSRSFLVDLCHLLGVDTPHPTAELDYMFERPITFSHGDGSTSAGRIDRDEPTIPALAATKPTVAQGHRRPGPRRRRPPRRQFRSALT